MSFIRNKYCHNLLCLTILSGKSGLWAMKKEKYVYIFIYFWGFLVYILFCFSDQSFFNFSFSSILLKVCALLKNRAQEIRDIARSTLAKIIEDLGVHYLQYILKELQTTLVRGYQVNCIMCFVFKLGWSFYICGFNTISHAALGLSSVQLIPLDNHQEQSEVSNQYFLKLQYLIFEKKSQVKLT